MEANQHLTLAMLLTGTAILTVLFSKGYLNTLISNILRIIKSAIIIPISSFISFIHTFFIKPIIKIIRRIHLPLGIKIVLYFLIGIGILTLDHFYGTTLFEADETTFYHFIFQGTTYWVTQEALIIGGFFLGIGVFLLLMEILEGINKILSTPIHISIIIKK
ncbi:MAG: hypothetical protein WAV51_04005 [Microgenomates group bacterium]